MVESYLKIKLFHHCLLISSIAVLLFWNTEIANARSITPSAVSVNDAFGFIVQKNPSDPLATTLAKTAVSELAIPRLQIVSPYLMPTFRTSPGNLNMAGFLADDAAQAGAKALGIAADDTSEAVVIYRATKNLPVDFSAVGGILTPYSDDFLSMAPATTGGEVLTVDPANFKTVNGKKYAIVLLRPKKIWTLPLKAKASQDGVPESISSLAVIRPPAILVHGLWGGLDTFESLHTYLIDNQLPVNDHIIPFQYTNYLAFSDPEVSSSMIVEINSIINQLDRDRIIGGRVDIIAHSMGGLVARHLSTLFQYRSWHDRNRGRFRLIVTINTPEKGSRIATYLLAHAFDRNLFSFRSGRRLFWIMMCESFSTNKQVYKCFADAGMRLGPVPGSPLYGAIHSLDPNSTYMNEISAVSPKIPDAKWRAVISSASEDNRLPYFLNGFIAETTECIPARSTCDTIESILDETPLDGIGPPNDGVVSLQSQRFGADALDVRRFYGLGHTGLPILAGLTQDGRNVLHSSKVNALVSCWLDTSGDHSCQSTTAVSSDQSQPATARPLASRLLPRRILVNLPKTLELAAPLELKIRPESWNLEQLAVIQRDEIGHRIGSQTVELIRNGADVRARFTPQLLGNVTFEFWASFGDGAISREEVNVRVVVPKLPPTEFRGDAHFKEVVMGDIGSVYRLHPAARYSKAGARNPKASALYPKEASMYPSGGLAIALDGHVQYRLLPGKGEPVIDLKTDGTITALRPGTAKIQATFGTAVDVITAIVEPGQ